MVALVVEDFFQGIIKVCPDAFSTGFRTKVYGGFGAPGIGGAGVGRGSVGVAKNLSLFLPYQPGELPGKIAYTDAVC